MIYINSLLKKNNQYIQIFLIVSFKNSDFSTKSISAKSRFF